MNEHLELYLDRSGQRGSLIRNLELDQADVKHRKGSDFQKANEVAAARALFKMSHEQAERDSHSTWDFPARLSFIGPTPGSPALWLAKWNVTMHPIHTPRGLSAAFKR